MNDEIIRNTIAKMREAGLSDSVVASTLTDLGLSAGQIQSYLSGGPPSSSPRPAYAPPSNSVPPARVQSFSNQYQVPSPQRAAPALNELDHESLASRTSEKVMQRMDEREALGAEEDQLKDNITHLAMEAHGEQLQSTHQAVMDLHDKFDSTALDTISNRVSSLNEKVSQLSKDVSETKALASAVQSLMQKILEANQQLLFEMKNRK